MAGNPRWVDEATDVWRRRPDGAWAVVKSSVAREDLDGLVGMIVAGTYTERNLELRLAVQAKIMEMKDVTMVEVLSVLVTGILATIDGQGAHFEKVAAMAVAQIVLNGSVDKGTMQ